METAPSGEFPHFTSSCGGNSGPDAVFSLPNPYIISSMSEWRVSSLYTFSLKFQDQD